MRGITFADMVHCSELENPMRQQIFLLSRFFGKSETDIENMSIQEIKPMTEEMNEYFEKVESETHFSIEDFKRPKVEPIEPIRDRSEILDLRKEL